MGGSLSTQSLMQLEQKSDAKFILLLAFLRNELQKMKQCNKNSEDIRQQIQKIKTTFWQHLRQQNYKQIEKAKSVIFIGRTSVGKSSLLNYLFKTNLATSKASCTKQISAITKIEGITVFDCPGMDLHFDLVKNPENIPKYLGTFQHIYYLYDGIIDSDVVKTLMAMNKRFYLVRTKCDPDDCPQQNDEVRVKDQQQLKGIIGNAPFQAKVFLTSKKGGLDNEALLKHILQIQK